VTIATFHFISDTRIGEGSFQHISWVSCGANWALDFKYHNNRGLKVFEEIVICREKNKLPENSHELAYMMSVVGYGRNYSVHNSQRSSLYVSPILVEAKQPILRVVEVSLVAYLYPVAK
jgi:hypothetical protein